MGNSDSNKFAGLIIGKALPMWRAVPPWIRKFLRRGSISALLTGIGLNLALYIYAWKYGARWPLEGVPFFFELSVLTGSVLAGGTLAIAALHRVALYQLAEISDRIETSFKKPSLSSIRLMQGFFGAILLSAGLMLIALYVYRGEMYRYMLESSILVLGGGILFLIYCITGRQPNLKLEAERAVHNNANNLYIALVIGVVFAAISPLLSDLMKLTRFGGGLSIEYSLVGDDEVLTGGLFLRSKNSLTVWIDEESRFSEHPLTAVESIRYKQDGKSLLPPARLANRIKFLEEH